MQDCKQQILNTIPNNTCCSHAFLNVVILSSQTNKDKTRMDNKKKLKNDLLFKLQDEYMKLYKENSNKKQF